MSKAILPAAKTSDSKYARLADGLRRQIDTGALKPGDQLPSYAQMLANHGVGQNTVEKMYALLEQDGLIIREPNRGIFVAVSKRRGSTGAVGLFSMPSETSKHPYHSHLMSGIRDVAYKAQTEIVLLHDKSHIGLEKIDGILLCQRDADRVLQRLPMGLPAVSLVFKSALATSITADDYSGVQSAVEHLLSLNHRRIAHLSGAVQEWTSQPSRERLRAYKETLKAAGIRPNNCWVRPVFEPFDNFPARYEQVGYAKMRRWLEEDWGDLGCTALIAHNDDVAMGAIDALQEAGVRVPDHVSVIGYDGTEIAAAFRPRLTTVDVPLYEMGAKGMDLLLEQIVSGSVEESAKQSPIVFPNRLQIRESTAVSSA